VEAAVSDFNDSIAVIEVEAWNGYIARRRATMARITVRNLEDHVMQRLRERGAARGVSMEQEARDVLAASVGLPTTKGFDRRGLAHKNESTIQPAAARVRS
jgi:plasmid stability protein